MVPGVPGHPWLAVPLLAVVYSESVSELLQGRASTHRGSSGVSGSCSSAPAVWFVCSFARSPDTRTETEWKKGTQHYGTCPIPVRLLGVPNHEPRFDPGPVRRQTTKSANPASEEQFDVCGATDQGRRERRNSHASRRCSACGKPSPRRLACPHCGQPAGRTSGGAAAGAASRCGARSSWSSSSAWLSWASSP
jgi:hypothetical protein